MGSDASRILVVRGGAIGDFVLTLPVFAALRRRFPGAVVEVLGQPAVTPLALAGALAAGARSLEGAAMAGFFTPDGNLDPETAGWLGGFSLVISYLHDPERLFEANVCRCMKGRFIAGRHRPSDVEARPAAAVFLEALKEVGIAGADPLPRLSLAPQGRAVGSALALHPGSGSASKNWPEERWAVLITRLARITAGELVLVGGEAEEGRLERLARHLPPGRSRVAQGLPLVDLAGLLAGCRGFVGHDSGISHLAAALGVPSILLWGPSREAVWRPPQPWVRIVRSGEGLAALGVPEVLEAVRELAG